MPSSSPLSSHSLKWLLLAVLLLAGVVLALTLGPGSTPLVTPEAGATP
jgi:hypothetical protein